MSQTKIFVIACLISTPALVAQPAITWKMSGLLNSCNGPNDSRGIQWFNPNFNDSQWIQITVPHTIGQSSPIDRFYRGRFNLDTIPEMLFVSFVSDDGIWLYINEIFLGHWGADCHEAGCVNNPWCETQNIIVSPLDITPYLQTGVNIISAHVSNCNCQGGMWFDTLFIDFESLEIQKGPTNNYYQVIIGPSIQWEEANFIAKNNTFQNINGHLATITSQAEDQFLENLRKQAVNISGFTGTIGQELWIGGYQGLGQTQVNTDWEWVNNEGHIPAFSNTQRYSHWQTGQPDDCCNTYTREDNEENYLCIGLLGSYGWNDQTQPSNYVIGYIVEYETTQQNQPPQITHTPITSAIQGKEIWFSMDATDDQDQLETLVIYARITGERDFTPYPFVVSQGQTKYEVGISDLTQTLDGVEYYIEATDEQGLVGYHRSDDGAYFICVIDPDKKTPIIIIPGIMGTELYDDDEKIWIDWDTVKNIRNDTFLLRLLLQRDGITPDARDRCSGDFRFTCTSFLECPQLPPSTCVPGGRNIRVGSYLDIFPIFTSYRNLGEYLIKNGYEDEKSLFFFAYDWRLDIKDIAGALGKTIESLTPNCGDKVNIIAHSMGGVVVSSYLQQNPNNHRVEKIIFLGTPHYGSPQAYAALKGYKPLIKWMADEAFWDEWTEIWNWVELNTITFVSQNFPGCYQLLPRFDFITRDGINEPFKKSFGNLSNQNLVTRAENFHDLLNSPHPRDVEYYSIVGTGLKTLSGFKIDNGCIKPEIDLDGDGTVPLNSSTAFDLAQNFYIQEEHQNLPKNTSVQEKILNILNGNLNFPVNGIGTKPIKGKVARKYRKCSPITLKITDTEGNVTGQDNDGHIKDNIPESSHFVFEENEAGYIPYDGEYVVDIRGTATGVFTLTFEKVENNQLITQAIEYPNIPVTDTSQGTIILTPDSEAPELSYDVDGNGTADFKIMPGENPPAELQQMFVEPGDVNKDRRIDISDAITILGYLFLGSPIQCKEAGNINQDKTLDISDAIYLLEFLFLGTKEKPMGLIFCPGE